MIFAITGGGGYTGYHIGWKLQEGGNHVRLLDIQHPNPLWRETAPLVLEDALPKDFWTAHSDLKTETGTLEFYKVNILDKQKLKEALKEVDGIIHTASYGVSGKEQLAPHYETQEQINLTGTKNVLEVAVLCQVKVFVFTSTYNVIFGGNEIHNGNESMDYFPLHRHVDHYSRTKAIAEMLVLTTNGRQINSYGKTIRTSALRLNGIFGLGEQRHLSRIIKVIKSGLFLFTYGKKEALVDFVGIQNVVQAHIKVLMKLLKEQAASYAFPDQDEPNNASGEAFFINDSCPVNNFLYMKPLVEALGYKYPILNLNLNIIKVLAFVQEYLYEKIYAFYPFTPFVTPVEALKTGVTHYFSCEKASRVFNYNPTRPNDLSQIIHFHQKILVKNKSTLPKTLIFVIIFSIFYIFIFIFEF